MRGHRAVSHAGLLKKVENIKDLQGFMLENALKSLIINIFAFKYF